MWFYGQTLKRSLHALLGGFRVVSEECVHRHHHAGSTEATLNAVVLHHVLLQQIYMSISQYITYTTVETLTKNAKYKTLLKYRRRNGSGRKWERE